MTFSLSAGGGVTGYERMPKDEIGFVLIGPSGAGKTTLCDYLCDTSVRRTRYVRYLPLTTRPRRPKEGREYRFISQREMESAKKSPHVIFGNISYGNEFLTLWPEQLPEGSHYLYIYLPEAAMKLKQAFPNTKIIQIVPGDITKLKERIIERDPAIGAGELEKRLAAAAEELRIGAVIADAIINNDSSVEKVAANLRKVLLTLTNM